MLMLGESVLSLLIVEVVSRGREYFVTFYCGIISVCLLMYLYFVSGPTHVEEHAMSRHVVISYSICVLMQFYSAGLVIVGACYKLFMYEYTYENYEDEFGQRLRRKLIEYIRSLAGSSLGDIDQETRRQSISYFFCFGLALVWACSDIMMLMHKGLYYNMWRLRHQTFDHHRKTAIFLIFLRFALLVFIATLFLYVREPHLLTAIGMCCIVGQLLLRSWGDRIFPHTTEDSSDEENAEAAKEGKVGVDGDGDENDGNASMTEQIEQPSTEGAYAAEEAVPVTSNERVC